MTWPFLLIPVVLFCLATVMYYILDPKVAVLEEPTWGTLGGLMLIMTVAITRSSEPLLWAMIFGSILALAIVDKLRRTRKRTT